ncbi:MAG: hypothetical protein V9G09_09975 [Candidatus Nanopelagicales bacterium]
MLASTNYSAWSARKQQIRAVLGWSPSALVVTGRRPQPGRAGPDAARPSADGVPVLEMWDHDPRRQAAFVQIGFSHTGGGCS